MLASLASYAGEMPPQETMCPICGGVLNAFGDCMDAREHEDPCEAWMDDGWRQ